MYIKHTKTISGSFEADLEAVEVLDLGGGGVDRRLAHQHQARRPALRLGKQVGSTAGDLQGFSIL